MIKYQTKKNSCSFGYNSCFYLGSDPTLRTTEGELNHTLLHSCLWKCLVL